jgi:valyl-tRNA synthetase
MLDKTFEPSAIEKAHYTRWEKSGAFTAKVDGNAEPHVIMMPPPNVTGSLHIGHALTMTLQDTLTRYYRLQGRDALWLPGTDHAGIATQLVVERQLREQGKSRQDFSRDEFIDKIWEWKAESGGNIFRQLRRLGASCDWSREAFTMNDNLSAAVRKVFVQLYREKLLYRAQRLINWDPKMHTAVSDLEVVLKEQKGHMWYIKYPVEGQTERFITIATTRPETMLGDTAIIVHPEDERYRDLIGKFAVVPVVSRPIPIIADEYVDREFGTGAMKVTPAHDFNDWAIGQRHNLAVINVFDKNAAINDNGPAGYVGLDRFEARKKILSELEAQDLLVKTEDITHSVPVDEKTKTTILEPWLTEQWFVDAATLAAPAIHAVESGAVQLVPQHAENTFFEWMRNIQPWCVSRQIWWGHQIPAWYGPDGEIFVEETEEAAKLSALKHYGEVRPLTRDPDVLDTWFSSALWPFSTLGWPNQTPDLKKYYPGEVLVTGFDIIFFWVARMMMMGLHFMGDVPFRKVLFHGLVRDAQGQKMSKTKGNVVDPLDVVDQYGADALRFTLLAFAGQGRDIRLAMDRVEGYRNFATKLWNAARYAEMNNCAVPAQFAPSSVNHTLNRWILTELAHTATTLAGAIERYDFTGATSSIYAFVWGTFCDWYLELTKPILTGEGVAKDVQDETRATTAFILREVLRLLSPMMPYLTEELYTKLYALDDRDMLINGTWVDTAALPHDAAAAAEIDWLITLITEIRSVRADMNVPAGAKTRLGVLGADADTTARLHRYNDLLGRLARVDGIDFVGRGAALPTGSVQMVVGTATYGLPVADIIDLGRERARLEKEIARLIGDIRKIDQKLGDAQFVARAPQDIIAEQKERRAQAEAVAQKLSMALKGLQAA